MNTKTRPYSPAIAGLAFSCLLLGGCASEKAVLNQTQPLQERIDRVEQNLASTSNATLRAAESRNEALARQQGEQARLLTEVQTGIAQLRDQINGRDLRVNNALAQLEERDKALSARLAETQQQLNNVLTLAQDNARLNTRLQAAQTNADSQNGKLLAQIDDSRSRIGDISRLAQSSKDELAKLAEDTRKRQSDADRANDSLDKRIQAAEDKLDTLTNLVHEALALAAKEIFLANGKEAFTVTLTHDTVLYPQNDPTLDSRDIAKLNELATNLGKLDQEYHLDIQGHTANNSTEDNNYSLGKARAEVVKRYLHEKQGISISRMSTISYGASKPLPGGAENNRRIFIRVLVLK